MNNRILKTFLLFFIFNLSCSIRADDPAAPPYSDHITGDWSGHRTSLSNDGIDITVEYKADFMSNLSGGLKKREDFLDNLDIKFNLDGEKLFGIGGNKILIYFINNDGSRPNAGHVGSVQGVDNIEVTKHTFKLYEAWMEQSLNNDTFSILAGVHDLNSEFAVTDVTGNFLKPSFQLNQSFAQSGKNGPSVFPTPGLAARLKINPSANSYAMFAVFDGIPGDPTNQYGTHVDWKKKDGSLVVGEVGFTPIPKDEADSPNKIAFGVWKYTKKMPDLVDVNANGNPINKTQQGAYFLSSYRFYKDASSRTLAGFFRAGKADGNSEQVDWDISVGAVANGWVSIRPNAEIGFGLSQAHNSKKWMKSSGLGSKRNEYSYELYYRDNWTSAISLQPTLQYIVNPLSAPNIKNATSIGVRFDFVF